MSTVLVLIHSPLVGSFTWAPVHRRLAEQKHTSILPEIADSGAGPYWHREAESVARQLDTLQRNDRLVLVAHSGAGPLLPAIASLNAGLAIGACVFVDAGLPHPGLSRLESIERDDGAFGAGLREHLQNGGRFPEWSDDDLRDIVPDDAVRRSLIAELRPRSLDFFDEEMPGIEWPLAPCAYLQLSSAYAGQAQQAQAAGWPVRAFDAGHFHMLVDPQLVAAALIEVIGEILPVA